MDYESWMILNGRKTQENSPKVPLKASLRMCLGDMYVCYEAALEMCNLTTLSERREERCLNFAKKCLKHPVNKRFFPLNPNCHNLHEKSKEKYTVNFAKSGALKKSAIPYLQRRLNQELA